MFKQTTDEHQRQQLLHGCTWKACLHS